MSLQAMDFPPLTASAAAQEKRVPVATGAWASMRPVLPLNVNGNQGTPQNIRGEENGNDHRMSSKVGFFFPLENMSPTLFFPCFSFSLENLILRNLPDGQYKSRETLLAIITKGRDCPMSEKIRYLGMWP